MLRRKLALTACMVLLALSACTPAATPAPAAAPTVPSMPASLPTAPPAPTAVPAPTPIGGAEPKIAFVGKDTQGTFGVYVDGLFTGRPERVSVLSLPELEARYVPMKWSPDGERLVFWNRNDSGEQRIFVYDAPTGTVRDVGGVPGEKDVLIGIIDFAWSSDGTAVHVVTAQNDRADKPAITWKLDLSSGGASEIDRDSSAGTNSHVNSGIQCPDPAALPEPFSKLAGTGAGGSGPNAVLYDRLCFYPEFDAFGGLMHGQKTTDLVLFSPDAQVNRVLAKFPAAFHAIGYIDLLLSPDKSQVLIVGQGGDSPDWPSDTRSKGGQFSYAVRLDRLPIDVSAPAVFEAWKHIHHVFRWSPDGMDYLIAESTTDYQTMKSDDRFEIVRADSGAVLFRYRVLNQVTPVLFVGPGVGDYDMVWPVSP